MHKKLTQSLIPALSVALLVVTLGAAFGILSGRGPLIGMLSAAIICFITSLVGGTRYGVSSPTGPMTAAIAVIFASDQAWLSTHVSQYGADQILGLTLITSAVILMILNLLKVHQLLKWVPNLVIAGFLNGIAVLIIISQMNSLELWQDGLIMGITFLISIGFAKIRVKLEHPITQLLLSSFFVIILMTLISHLIGLELTYLDLSFASLFDSVNLNLPHFEWPLVWIILPLAFELSLVALLDTLLTGVIMEKKTKHKTKHMQELGGQSIALFVTGLISGLPGAQSTVPSMMLYKEGGHHKWSKLFVSIFAVLITLAFVPLIQYVPVAVFAGLIFKIAYDVADFTAVRSVFTHKEWVSPLILIGTLLSTVLLSVNLAVIGFTMIFVLWNFIMPKRFRITDLEAEVEAEGMIDEL